MVAVLVDESVAVCIEVDIERGAGVVFQREESPAVAAAVVVVVREPCVLVASSIAVSNVF